MERIRIDPSKEEVFVSFNKTIYPKATIEQAMEDYGQACEVFKNKDEIMLRPKEKLDLDTLGYEFYNYVLGLMKNGN